MEIQFEVGCRMGGLRQTCAQTIHGYYICGLKFPFFMFWLNCYCMRRHEKAYEYTTMLDMFGMNNNNNSFKC